MKALIDLGATSNDVPTHHYFRYLRSCDYRGVGVIAFVRASTSVSAVIFPYHAITHGDVLH